MRHQVAVPAIPNGAVTKSLLLKPPQLWPTTRAAIWLLLVAHRLNRLGVTLFHSGLATAQIEIDCITDVVIDH